MKLILIKEKRAYKGKIKFGSINGYILPSYGNKFKILGTTIKNILVTNRKFARPFVLLQVNTRFQKLIEKIVDLLVTEDGSGESARIALNHIEKFRQLIKNEYRQYLKRNELEYMAKQLEKYQKAANKSFLISSKKSRVETIGRGR